MPSGSRIIIGGAGGGGNANKDFARVCDDVGFEITNGLSETTGVLFAAYTGGEDGVTIQIAAGSTIYLGPGCVEGVP